MDVKKFQFIEMKHYDQQIKSWDDKQFQVNHKEIVNQTKTVTDWLMEDIFHIRKATLSSYGLDFNPQVNKVFQNQLYFKLEYKLLLLLQIILYREIFPAWKPTRDKYGRPIQSEQEQKIKRMNNDKKREEDDQRYCSLFTSEEKLLSDLKTLLLDVTQLKGKTIDGRAKSELLKIFLVDYNEIVKYKNDQLSRIQEIEDQLGIINENFTKIEGKSLHERLYQTKIGHIKNQQTDEISDQQCLQQLDKHRCQLQKERNSILVNSAQVFQIKQNDKENENINSPDNSPKNSQNSSPQFSLKKSPKLSPKQSPKQSPRLSPYLQPTKILSENNSKAIKLNSQNKVIKQVNPFDKSKYLEYNLINNMTVSKSISKNDLHIQLSRANSNASYRFSEQASTPQKSLLKQKNQFFNKSNNQGPSPSSRGLNVSISTPKSKNDYSPSGNQSNRSQRQFVQRSLNKSLTQRSIFSQYNQESTLINDSPKSEQENKVESRLTNRQIMNATPTKEFCNQREKQEQPERKTPDKFKRNTNHSNTICVAESSNDCKENQIKLLHSKTTELDFNNKKKSFLVESPQVQSGQRSKSPTVTSQTQKKTEYNYKDNAIKLESENVQTKLERNKSRKMSSRYQNEIITSCQTFTPQKQTFSNFSNSPFSKSSGKISCQSNKKIQSCLNSIQEKDWRQIFQNAKHRQNKVSPKSVYKK